MPAYIPTDPQATTTRKSRKSDFGEIGHLYTFNFEAEIYKAVWINYANHYATILQNNKQPMPYLYWVADIAKSLLNKEIVLICEKQKSRLRPSELMHLIFIRGGFISANDYYTYMYVGKANGILKPSYNTGNAIVKLICSCIGSGLIQAFIIKEDELGKKSKVDFVVKDFAKYKASQNHLLLKYLNINLTEKAYTMMAEALTDAVLYCRIFSNDYKGQAIDPIHYTGALPFIPYSAEITKKVNERKQAERLDKQDLVAYKQITTERDLEIFKKLRKNGSIKAVEGLGLQWQNIEFAKPTSGLVNIHQGNDELEDFVSILNTIG